MQDTLDHPIAITDGENFVAVSKELLAASARHMLIKARKELARRHPQLAHRVMHVSLLDPRNNLKYLEISPNTVFASDNLEAVHGVEWVLRANMDELVFVWAQFAIKFHEGWNADMRLSGRNPQWQNMAIDAVANARLRRDGIGQAPKGAIHFDEVGPDTDPLEAYNVVREFFERFVTTEDEVGQRHLDHDGMVEILDELDDHMPFPEQVSGMYELTICCE